MATMTLVASTYSTTGTVSVTNPENMYTDVDSTTYSTITHTTSGTTSYYCYIKGFNFSSVPSNAEVSSIVIRIKGRSSGLSTSTSYAPRLYNNTSTITGASAASSNFGTSSSGTTITVPYTGDWDTLKGYGANLGIRVVIRRSSRNTQGYLYVYGAEIEVTYTIPVYYDITASGDGTLEPSGTTSVLQGESYTLEISGVNNPTVKDNNVDVTSQLVQRTGATDTLIPVSNTNSGWYSVTDIANAYDDADSTNYANLQIAGGNTTATVYLDMSDLSIPSSANILSVTAKATSEANRNNSSSGFSSSIQMYAGSTAKGSATSWVTAGGTAVAKTTFTLSVGSWTASEINNARFYLTATNNAGSTRRYVYIYGVSFEVTYESDDVTYIYTISNVTGAHTIVVTDAPSNVLLVKAPNETLVVDKTISGVTTTVSGNTKYYEWNQDLSGIANGDTVRIFATLYLVDNGTITNETNVSMSVVWNGSTISYGGGIFTLWIGTSTIRIIHSTSYSGTLYARVPNGDANKFQLYKFSGTGWVPAIKAYKKISGSWVEQSDLTAVFSSGVNYVKG